MYAGVRLKLSYQLVVSLPVVDLLLAVRSLAARAVKPDAANIAVAGQKLCKLSDKEIIVLLALAVVYAVSVPRRAVHSKLYPLFTAGIRHLFHNVALSVPERAARNGMRGSFRLPQAEAVMVLAGQYKRSHSCALDSLHPLTGVKFGRIKNILILGTVSPLPAGICVDGKMNESVKLKLLMKELPFARSNAHKPTIKLGNHFFFHLQKPS